MKKLLLLILLFSGVNAYSQISLTYLNHWRLTPNSSDSSGVFCRIYFDAVKDKYYVVYAGRPSISSGPQQYYKWREFDHNFSETGASGTLAGSSSHGDYAMVQVGRSYYHVTGTFPYGFKLTKYDSDFNIVTSTNIPLDSSDSQADMMMNYTNGKLIIGAFHVDGVYHPTMPGQLPSWNPYMHKWEYDTMLSSVASPSYLNQIFNTWGSSCIYHDNKYNIMTMHKFPDFSMYVWRYDSNWNYIDSISIRNDGQWSQGLLWDGSYYIAAYHTGHEHRCGNITVSFYDNNWNSVYDTTITSNSTFIPNVSPPLNVTDSNANRPFLLLKNDTLFVSYDQDDFQLTSYAPPIFAEGSRWQAHVMALRINRQTTSIPATENNQDNFSFEKTGERLTFYINATTEGKFEVFDTSGKLIYRSLINAGAKELIHVNSPGLYLISLENSKEKVSKKIVVD
ncbi:MAG: T9SS type A sorting domain-containing protein [Bacteroidia bacterium]